MRRYEAFAVREYWIVDAGERIVEQYRWETGSYRLAGRHTQTVSLSILPDVAVDLGEVW